MLYWLCHIINGSQAAVWMSLKLACLLYLHGLKAKDSFYILKWLGKKKERSIFHDTWNIKYSNVEYSNFIAKLIALHIVCSYFLTKMAKLRSYDRNCMQRLKYLLLGSIWKKFADSYTKGHLYFFLAWISMILSTSFMSYWAKLGLAE